MERRKFLIGAGTLGAGASVALGTGAFTTVEAQRNVDIGTAGDANAQLAIQALNGANANELISTEDDETLSLSIPDVNQDAVTEVEDLFRIVNQGTQPVSLFFRDDSDAVTFRVTRSAQSLEGTSNSIQLEIGSQVVVGLTVNTLDNNVSGELLDNVTIIAEASASASAPSGPQPQYVVDGSGNGDNTFTTISRAVSAADSGSVIGIRPVNGLEVSELPIEEEDLTITGFGGTPVIDGGDPGQGGAIQVNSDNVTLKGFDLEYDGTGANQGIYVGRNDDVSGVTIDNVSVTNTGTIEPGVAPIQLNANDSELINSVVDGGAISLVPQTSDSQLTVTGNLSKNAPKEGIFAFGSDVGDAEFTFTDNSVENHDQEGNGVRQVKFASAQPNSINGARNKQGQLESLLVNNDINSANVTGSFGTRATGSAFSSLQEAVDTAVASPNGVTLVEAQQNGSYNAVSIPKKNTEAPDGLLLKAIGTGRPVINGETNVRSASASNNDPANDVTVEGLRFEGPSRGAAVDIETSGPANKRLTFRDNEFVASDLGVFANNIENSTFDDNLFTVAQNTTARELLPIGQRVDDSDNGSNVNVTNNDFQTPGDTSLERNGQGANAIEFGPDSGTVKDNNFNVDTDNGNKVLIGKFNDSLTATKIAENNEGVSESEVKDNSN